MLIRIFFLFSFVGILCSCRTGSRQVTGSEPTPVSSTVDSIPDFRVDSVKSYCWCFAECKNKIVFSCATQINVDPKYLIKDTYFFDRTSDEKRRDVFRSVIGKFFSARKYNYGVDARFLFVADKKERKDTL